MGRGKDGDESVFAGGNGGRENPEVAATLTGLPGVATVDVVTGPYDIIAMISAEDISVVGELVTGRIHTVNGVVRTVTCVAVGG